MKGGTTRRVCAAALVLSACGAALAQPANDGYGDAEPITGYGAYPFSTVGATTDGVNNPMCLAFGTSAIYNDVWFCFTSEATEPVRLSLCSATYDTRIAVYAGCGPGPEAGGILGCNDDSSACGTRSILIFNATAGQQYMIRVGAYATGGFGSGSLEVSSGLPGVVTGPVSNPANGHQYYLLEASGWLAAEAKAVALGGHLVTVNDAAENEWVRVNMANYLQDRRVWTGLNDASSEGNFVWVSGQPVTYTNWSGGEPNNSGGAEHYAELFGSNGLWNDNTETPAVTVYGVAEVEPTAPCPADADGNTRIEPADIAVFVQRWINSLTGGTLEGDFDHNNAVEPADIASFVQAWLAALTNGC